MLNRKSRAELICLHAIFALGRVGTNKWLDVQVLSMLLAVDAALRR